MEQGRKEQNKRFVLSRVHYYDKRPNELCLEVYMLSDTTGTALFTDRQSRFVPEQYKSKERLAVIAERCIDKEVYLTLGDIIDTIDRDYITSGVEKRLQVDMQTFERFEEAMKRTMQERADENKKKAV